MQDTTELVGSVAIDPRMKQMSYSSSLTLHACPRKYQIYKLMGKQEDVDDMSTDNLTFAYGHVVGTGVQYLLEGRSLEETVWRMFLDFHADLFAENPKQNKSFYTAVIAIQKFAGIAHSQLLSDYDLVYWEDKPAVELSFSITTPDKFKFRGFVDAVLVNRYTDEVMILEVKTTSSTVLDAAQYKNSSQALGYSVVLDVLFPELSSYKVMYMPYQTKSMEWSVLPFTKTYLQRAQWIQQLILDVETIKLYEATGVYPMYGESCYNYFKPCEYFGICSLNTASLAKPLDKEWIKSLEEETFSIELTLAQLIQAQLSKG